MKASLVPRETRKRHGVRTTMLFNTLPAGLRLFVSQGVPSWGKGGGLKVRYLLHKHDDLSLVPRIHIKMLCGDLQQHWENGDKQTPGALWSASLANQRESQSQNKTNKQKTLRTDHCKSESLCSRTSYSQ